MTYLTSTGFGKLFLVATPIGNLKDITLRAVETLQNVDLIAAEDTRHSHILLNHLGIKKPLLSLHSHNENTRSSEIIEKLKNGLNIALISDAGTPLISDPGYTLVRLARENHLDVIPIPGACALIAALSASGLSCGTFFFAGFAPVHTQARQNYLKNFSTTDYTLIFYEAPHRILDFIEDAYTVFEQKKSVVLAKEITKTFECFFSGSLADAIIWLKEAPEHQKGEFVVMFSGTQASNSDPFEQSIENVLKPLLKALPLKQAVQLAAEITGQKKNKIYAQALAIQQVL